MSLPIHHDRGRAEHLADVLKALGHPLRLRIVSLLSEGESHVNALALRLGAPQAIVSQQLRILRMSSLVEAVRQNGFAYYKLSEPQLHNLLACMSGCNLPVRAGTPADAAVEAAVAGKPELSP